MNNNGKQLHNRSVYGLQLDTETRCEHYGLPVDIIAIRFYCCDRYYACKDCHEALEHHVIKPWPVKEQHQLALLCGVCGHEMSIRRYKEKLDSQHCHCDECSAAFNPKCQHHVDIYFE